MRSAATVHASLPWGTAVIVAACLEFAAVAAPGARTMAFGRLLYDPGSPGLAFKLTESALTAAVEAVAAENSDLTLADTAGLVQLAFRSDPAGLGRQLLSGHYQALAGAGGVQ